MNERIGILGGGQLGKMLYLAGGNLDLNLHILDRSRKYPAGKICRHFTAGDFTQYEDVIQFGKDMDILTIEIEKINVDALDDLMGMGKTVYPSPDVIRIIQDKGKQKAFYVSHGFPTSPFQRFEDLDALKEKIQQEEIYFPFIQKACTGGYDGRGVLKISSKDELSRAFPKDFIVEESVQIEKEISIIVCGSPDGTYIVYDPVEMVFDPDNHILLYQLAPADIANEQVVKCKKLALDLAQQFGVVGLLAIEMFIDESGNVLINECAPRPHNSGHHTIEAAYCSQYENHLRAISGLPLGSPKTLIPSLLLNLLGAKGYSGKVKYEGLDEVLAMEGVSVHIYGKEETRPHRKMGHITIIDPEKDNLVRKYHKIRNTLIVKT
jgi:5-(carboxyamino)imidazole ribonucleotide synthase